MSDIPTALSCVRQAQIRVCAAMVEIERVTLLREGVVQGEIRRLLVEADETLMKAGDLIDKAEDMMYQKVRDDFHREDAGPVRPAAGTRAGEGVV
jgi:hypothetical protein